MIIQRLLPHSNVLNLKKKSAILLFYHTHNSDHCFAMYFTMDFLDILMAAISPEKDKNKNGDNYKIAMLLFFMVIQSGDCKGK